MTGALSPNFRYLRRIRSEEGLKGCPGVADNSRVRRIHYVILTGAALVIMAGCSTRTTSRRVSLTRAQRDSVLATETAIPGSAVVGTALNLQVRSARRIERFDAEIDSLTR